MVVKLADRVSESAQATGTGSFTLGGPSETQYIAFSTAFTTGDLISYVAVQGEKWEIGTGTLLSETQLSRDFVWNTSDQTGINSQNIPGSSLTKISFDSGTTITIFVGLPSHLVLALDENGDLLDPSPFRNVVFIDTLTAMKALAGLSDGETVVVIEDEVGGIFKWDATDSTAADDIDTFRNDNSSGVGLHKRVSIRVQASFNGSMTVDAAAAGDSYIDLFTAKKASNATKYFRWFTDAANNAVRLAGRLNQGSLTNFLSVYSTGDNADRVAFDKPAVLATRSDAQGIKNKTLAWLSGVSRLVMATADAANNTTEAAYKEIPLTKGGFIVSDVIDVYALKQVDPVVAGFADGDRAIARGSNTVSGSSSSGNSGNTKALIYYWASTSTASADDIKVVRPSVGAAATGNGRWLLLVSDITKTMTSGDASPTVAGCEWLITAGSTAITNFDDGYEGQIITVERASADIVITHDPTKINIGGQNRTLTATSPRASFRLVGSVWKCIDAGDIADRIQNTLTAGVTTIGAAQDIVLSSIKATGAGNLCYNSSFEVGTGTVADGWSMSSSGGVTATASIVTSTLNVAGRAQQVVLSGLSSSLVNDIRTIANGAYFMPLDKPQGTFTASAMLYAPVGLNARIILQFGTVSGNTFTVVNTATGTLTAATGAWQQITATGAAGATATHAIMFLRTAGGSLTAGTVLWDNAQLEQGSIATTWRENVSRDRFSRFYNVLDACTSQAQRVGVVAGTVNLDTIWTAALTAAIAANMNIYIPPGTYTLGSSVTGLPLNIGANAVGVQGAGLQTKITKTAGNQSVFYCNVICPTMLNGRLDTDVAPGATTLHIESGQNPGTFAANDLLLLNDLGTLIIDNTRRGGEFVTVQSISGDTVTLWHPIKYTHLAGTTSGKYARLTKPTMLNGVFVKDMWLDANSEVNSGTDTVNTIDVSPEGMIVLRWAREAVVSGIKVTNFGCSGVRCLNTYQCTIENSVFIDGGSSTTGTSDPTSTEGLGGFSYAVCEVALNEGLTMRNVRGIGVRHVHTTTSAAMNDASTVYANYGEPYGTKILGCQGWHCKNMTFDQHELGRNIYYENCTAYDCHYAGWQIRTREVTLRNCAVINSIGPAVWIRGSTSGNAYADHCTIDGMDARYTNLGTSFDSIDWTVVGAVLDDAPNTRTRRISAYKTGGPALTVGDSISPNNSQHSDIMAEDICQLAASNKYAVYLKKVGTTGVCRIDRLRSYSSDAKVVDLVNVDSGVGAATIRLVDIDGTGHSGNRYTNNSTSAVFTYNSFDALRVSRTSTQYFDSISDTNYNGFKSYSPSTAAKGWIVDVTTDAAGTSPSGGSNFWSFRIRGTTRWTQTDTGKVQINGVDTITGDRAYVPPSFTATNIGSAAHSVNTTDKLVGKTIYDSTNNRQLMALGTSATSGWALVSGGAAVITPS